MKMDNNGGVRNINENAGRISLRQHLGDRKFHEAIEIREGSQPREIINTDCFIYV
jgi:hypothetical protein